MSGSAFDPLKVLSTLARHRVRFVLVGSLAGRLWGSPTVTNDIDLCYARDDENLLRLTRALRELGARLRGVPEDVRFLLEPETLAAGDHFTFATDAGNVDCLGTPAGSAGYDDLIRTAERMEMGDQTIEVVALEDLIRMKLAAGRPKDRIEVEVLGAVREELERRDD